MLTPTGITIGRLRVRRGGSADADPSRSAARALGLLDIRPAALPRGATLCVRRLQDPAPGRLRLGLRDAAEAATWRMRVEGALADLARDAARPADGPVPAGADAVLFRDEVELLACLAADWSRPGGRSNWWWQRVVPSRPDDAVARAWLARIAAVPSVVDRLARRGELAGVLGSGLDDADVRALVDALAGAFGIALPGRWRVGGSRLLGPGSRRTPPPRPARTRASLADVPRPDRERARFRTPWPALHPELAGLDQPRTLFAGIALTVARSPHVVRTTAFASAIAAWLGDGSTIPARSRISRRQPGGPPATARRGAREAGKLDVPPNDVALAARPRDVAAATPPRRAPKAAVVAVVEAVRRGPERAAVAGVEVESAQGAEAAAANPAMAAITDTRLGGVFFLLDLAIYLGIYGDFSQPREPGIELDPWDFLTLLAGALGSPHDLDADPLGELLRTLAGRRRGRRAGAGWRPDPDWAAPPDWLVPFAGTPGAWRWSRSRGRLRVEHPAGFPVLDVPAAGRMTAARVRRAIRTMPDPVLRRAALPRLPTDGRREVDRWIARIAAYARARLALAFGLDPGTDVGARLLRLPARITTTVTEVDVEFALAELPIEVRIAGLDRDPGWVPAARRTVRFHFR